MDEALDPADLENARAREIRHLLKRATKHEGSLASQRGEATRCFRCRRMIEPGDPVKVEVVYDAEGALEVRTHRLDCATYNDRPRPAPSELRLVITQRGQIRRATMATETETPTTDETETATPTKAKKSKKGKGKSKGKSKSKGNGKTKSSKKAKKAKSEETASTGNGQTSANVSLAETLRNIAFDTKGVKTILDKLEKDTTPSNDEMLKLRDHIKAEAARLRAEENEKSQSAASELSSANRAVRRLERSTR